MLPGSEPDLLHERGRLRMSLSCVSLLLLVMVVNSYPDENFLEQNMTLCDTSVGSLKTLGLREMFDLLCR